MTARSSHGSSARSSVLALFASCLSAAACSAPPGAESGDGDVPEFGAFAPPANTAPAAPVAAPTGNATNGGAAAPSPAGAGGATGSPGNEQTGSSGIGLDPAQNGAQNGNASGASAGAGGSSMAGPAPGANAGAAGSSFDPGANAGAAGSTSLPPADGNLPPEEAPQQPEPPPQPEPPAEQPAAPPPAEAPPPSGDCNGAFFCDGFESVANGESPTAALWTLMDNFGITEQSANVQVSNANARTGTQALRITGNSGRTGINATLPQSNYFVRAFMQIGTVTRGTVFIGAGVDQNNETRFRVQGENIATINTVGGPMGDPVRPANANGGECPDCLPLTANEWLCVELAIDNAAQTATLFVDGVQAAVAGADAFPTQPATPNLFLGSWGLQGGVSDVLIDDVAVGPERFGCD